MTVDVSEFETASLRQGPVCTFASLSFTPEQKAKLDLVIDHRPDITTAAIYRVLKGWGYNVSDTTIARHRRRECHCPKAP